MKRQPRKTKRQRNLERAAKRWERKRAQRPELVNCESPIERNLLLALRSALQVAVSLRTQVPIGPYRVDFLAIRSATRLVIEADGAAYHSAPEEVAYDVQRDAYLKARGYQVMRFTGSQIARAAEQCAGQVAEKFGSCALPPLTPAPRMTNGERKRQRRRRIARKRSAKMEQQNARLLAQSTPLVPEP